MHNAKIKIMKIEFIQLKYDNQDLITFSRKQRELLRRLGEKMNINYKPYSLSWGLIDLQ